MIPAAASYRKCPTAFGRRMTGVAAPGTPSTLAEDVRLFAMFFVGGFTFMGVYLA